MEIQHFSHEHSLILTEELKDDERHYQCFGCIQTIDCPYYRCNKCMRFLHKSCAELPEKINHPIHPQHPLALHASPPNPYLLCKCDACGGDWGCFTYHCADCKFDVDVNCASFPHKIDFGGHEHPLILLAKPASFTCDACGTTHAEGASYQCSTCMLWVHQDCASLPSTTTVADHDHPLSLTYSLLMGYSRYKRFCKICEEEVLKKCWVYYCAGCKYVVHLKCAASETQPQPLRDRMSQILADDHLPNLVRLPILNPDVDVLSHIFKDISLGKKERAIELKHFSHDHQLTLFEEPKTSEVCNGCARSISSSFYGCPQCKFFLHKWCAELPNEIQHAIHKDHPFTLLPKAPDFCGLFKCGICFNFSNGFTFLCAPCNSYLDIKCGSYPATLEHEGHKHPLKLRLNLQDWCSACNKAFVGLVYECEPCRFLIDIQCAFLPQMIWHRYDKDHPFVLTYSLVDDPSEEFYCEFCEEEMFTNFWFYHNVHHNWAFHTRCLSKVDDECSNIKFGGTIDLKVHPHSLTLAKKVAAVKPSCDHCGDPCDVFAFECKQCNYNLHANCASMYAN